MRALLEDEQAQAGGESEEMFKEEVDDVEFKQKGKFFLSSLTGSTQLTLEPILRAHL
jgi:hypothetical protein